MWLSLNSEIEEPVLIEIEAPNKPWFTNKGQRTSHLTEALTQIGEWKSWLGEPSHIAEFKRIYGLDRESPMRRNFKPSYLLLYGRREEATANPGYKARHNSLLPPDIQTKTYDELRPDRNADQMVCLKLKFERGNPVSELYRSLQL